jgi:hypothetical protein
MRYKAYELLTVGQTVHINEDLVVVTEFGIDMPLRAKGIGPVCVSSFERSVEMKCCIIELRIVKMANGENNGENKEENMIQ